MEIILLYTFIDVVLTGSNDKLLQGSKYVYLHEALDDFDKKTGRRMLFKDHQKIA